MRHGSPDTHEGGARRRDRGALTTGASLHDALVCPPGRLPEGRRRLLVRFAHGGSVEGGRLELCESFATSASSSAFLRWSRKL